VSHLCTRTVSKVLIDRKTKRYELRIAKQKGISSPVHQEPSPTEKVKDTVPNPGELIEVKHTYSYGFGRGTVGRMVRRRDSVKTMNEFKRTYGN
jgi:hypothetical protein